VSWTCGTPGRGETCLQDFDWEARRRETTGRPRLRWEDKIKLGLMEVKSIGRTGFNWLRIGFNGGIL
jgi:hypothetical protein